MLPDLINFDAPSTSKFEDYHTMPKNKDMESISISSTVYSDRCSESRASMYSKMSAPSLSIPQYVSEMEDIKNIASRSNVESVSATEGSCVSVSKSVPSLSISRSVSETEDSYVFAAGYALNLAVSCEQKGDYRGAFDCYKLAIEKMLIGVRSKYILCCCH